MIFRVSYILVLISLSVTLAHKSIGHHHHVEQAPAHHPHQHEEGHNSFSFVDLDDEFIPNSHTAQLQAALAGVRGFELRIHLEKGSAVRLFHTRTDHPPPDPLTDAFRLRGPPLV